MNEPNEQIARFELQKKLEADRAKVLEELSSRHKMLSDRFGAMTLAASFGSLFLLMNLEGTIPKATANSTQVLCWAWGFAYLSCVFGAIHLWLEMMFPPRMHGLTVGMPLQPNETWTQDLILKRIAEKQSGYMWHNIPFFLHLILLIGVFVTAATYRFSNL